MKGTVKNILPDRNFGFIKASNSAEYFFHREDYNGHWDDLKSDVRTLENSIEVTFDVVDSPKGPRAANVRRTDWPNEAV